MSSLTSYVRRILILLLISLLLMGPAARSNGGSAGVTVVDDLGRKIVLPHSVKRIVSLEPSVTEILFAVGAGNKLVGDTDFCDYPPAAKKLAHVGGEIDLNIEKVVALRPDIVIAANESLQPAEADQLAARFHAPLYVTAPRSYSGVVEDIRNLGALAGDKRDTESAVRSMQATLATVQKAVQGKPKRRVFAVVWENPLMTASGRSFIGDLIRLVGGTNIAEDEPGLPYPGYSAEKLVAADPDIILVRGKGDQVQLQHAQAPWLRHLKLRAVLEGQVYAVPSDWTDRPGPRLGLGLEAIARILHPEAFQTKRR